MPTTLTHTLPPNSEWRFEVSSSQTITVTLLSGTAELFGTELAPSQPYSFTLQKSSIFTFHGCRLSITGPLTSEYVAEETPMTSYANLHFALDNQRQTLPDGLRVMIIGPRDSGKTSLAKILTAYAIKAGRQPLVVNTDPKEGVLSLPGSLTATAMGGGLLDVQEGGGWGSSPTSGPSSVPVKLPLVYYWGGGKVEDEREGEGYRRVTARLAVAVGARLREDREAREGGVIVDTPGGISQGGTGYEIVAHLVAEFDGESREDRRGVSLGRYRKGLMCGCSQCAHRTGLGTVIQ